MTEREKIVSNKYYDIVSDFSLPRELAVGITDLVYQPVEGEIGIAYVNRNELPPLNIPFFTYLAVPKLYGLMQMELLGEESFDPTALVRSGISQVQREPLNLTGRGVVIGFLDTGIQYDNAVFRNQDGSTRILSIWDQTIQTGEPPEGILYGTEYNREMINQALGSENPRSIVPSYDENGHGTALASVAAGSMLGNGLRFQGAAPEADIVMVKLREAKAYLKDFFLVQRETPAYAESDILVALRYLESYAVSLRRPLIICFGLGSNMGDHEGHSVLANYMNQIATRRSRAIIVCGGNEGNAAHHYRGNTVEGLQETTDNVEIRVGDDENGFTAELWGNISANHAISIRAPGGETTARVDFRGQNSQEFGFIYERTKIQVYHVLVERGSGEELIFLRFVDPSPGIWTLRVFISDARSAETTFHVWLPISNFISNDTFFLRPSPYITLTEPSNVREVITTTTYQDTDGSFWPESGRGFTRLEQIKPEICAPGVAVSTILGKGTGASLAAAIAAGAAAQFMQWAVVEGNQRWAENRELKNYLIRGATRLGNQSYPNRELGYGYLNIAGTFEVLAGI